MNLGYFASFTVFLALNDAGFCNAHLRRHPAPEGLLPLATYLRAWGWAYLAITLAIAYFKAERNFQQGGARPGESAGCACIGRLRGVASGACMTTLCLVTAPPLTPGVRKSLVRW